MSPAGIAGAGIHLDHPRMWKTPIMIRHLLLVAVSVALFPLAATAAEPASSVKPLKVMLITGGCCHDYAKQKDLLKAGIEARAHVVVDLMHTDDKSTKARFPMFESADWAKGYDVIIHDECSADVKEMSYVQNVLAPHKAGVPAVNLHCAMHCYRTGTDDWFDFIGLRSSGHGPQKPIEISFIDRDHPVTKTLENWTTINEELYNNLKVYDSARPLARGRQGNADTVVVWTNDYGKTRVFNTTIGHNNATVGDPRYLDLVTRGLLWSCDKLNDTYLKPAPKVAEAPATPQPTPAK